MIRIGQHAMHQFSGAADVQQQEVIATVDARLQFV
jgi:hypothetical protein